MARRTTRRHVMRTIHAYAAWVTPSNRTYHWVDEDNRQRALCGARNRGWRRVLDLKGNELNATARARECGECDRVWREDRLAANGGA